MLSDGFRVPGLPMPSLPVVGGDAAAACIAAASVLAKVSRDRLMVADGVATIPATASPMHKGYSTPLHTAALAELGPCSEHRYSFINVRRLCGGRCPTASAREPRSMPNWAEERCTPHRPKDR